MQTYILAGKNKYIGNIVGGYVNLDGTEIPIENVRRMSSNPSNLRREVEWQGMLYLNDGSEFHYSFRRRGMFKFRWEGSLDGYVEIFIASINATKRISLSVISDWTNATDDDRR